MTSTSLLSGDHVSVISHPYDGEVATIAATVRHSARVGGRGDLEVLFCELLSVASDAITSPRTLDLIGHSTPDGSLLRMGSWVIDAEKRSVTAFFRELADLDVMRRLGIRAVRLLGCETATTLQGRSTICAISEILGIEVLGARTMLNASYYTPNGFSSDFLHALAQTGELLGSRKPTPLLNGEPYRRTLDLDALPASPISAKTWPTAIASPEQAREIVRVISRNDGAYLPGLSPIPLLEIGLPSTVKPSWFHTIQVIVDGTFVRVYPDAHGPGVVFRVDDPERLRDVIRTLERVRPAR